MPRKNRARILLAGCAAVGLLLVGCTSQQSIGPTASQTAPGTNASSAAFVRQAADTTTQAGSARISSQTTMGGSGDAGTAMTVQGVANFADKQLALTLQSGLLGADGAAQIIVTGGKTYLQMPMLGKKWIEAPMQDMGVNVTDPSQSLASLKEIADLQEAGTEDIDGVEATKYTGTVDLQKALSQSGLPLDKQQQLAGKLKGTADVTVWIDGKGRIIRFDQNLTVDSGNGHPVDFVSSTTLSEFGVATDIQPPPADQIMDLGSLKNVPGLTDQ